MKLAIGVIGGILLGGLLAAQVSGDAVILGVLGGGVVGALIARRFGAESDADTDGGPWYDGSEQGYDDGE